MSNVKLLSITITKPTSKVRQNGYLICKRTTFMGSVPNEGWGNRH